MSAEAMIVAGEWVVTNDCGEEVARGPLLAKSKEAALFGDYVYGPNDAGQTPTLRTNWSVTATVEQPSMTPSRESGSTDAAE